MDRCFFIVGAYETLDPPTEKDSYKKTKPLS